MTDEGIFKLVTSLYSAAGGREATDVDFAVYAEALDDLSDEAGLAAGRALCRGVDLVTRKPSPALVRDTAAELANREYLRHSVEMGLPEATGEPVAAPEALAWIARIRQSKTRRGGQPQHIGESLP